MEVFTKTSRVGSADVTLISQDRKHWFSDEASLRLWQLRKLKTDEAIDALARSLRGNSGPGDLDLH